MTTPLRVLVSDPNLVEHQSRLEELVADVASCHWVADPTSEDSLNALAQADVFVGTTFTPAMTEHASRLQAVLVPGAGHDGIDKSALPAGVPVANTFHHEASIAEYVVACAVMLRRSLWQQAHALTDGVWASSVHDPSLRQPATLGASTVGIIGYGHIGQAVWRLLQPFGSRGRAIRHSPMDATPDGLDWIGTSADLPRLLSESDVVVLCTPLTDESRGMIGAAELDLLGPDGVLINVGRGPLVDETALYTALRDDRIGGAAIDVWYRYPDPSQRDAQGRSAVTMPANEPFGELPNVITTPHVSGVSSATFTGRVGDIAEAIHRLVAGQPLDRVVHP